MPEPTSVPDHCTVKLVLVSVAGNAVTRLTGGVLSNELHQVGVLNGALKSNTTVAWLQVTVLVVTLPFGATEYTRVPMPWGGVTSGGRKPASGSVVNWPEVGSIDWKSQVTNPVLLLRPAWSLTWTF